MRVVNMATDVRAATMAFQLDKADKRQASIYSPFEPNSLRRNDAKRGDEGYEFEI